MESRHGTHKRVHRYGDQFAEIEQERRPAAACEKAPYAEMTEQHGDGQKGHEHRSGENDGKSNENPDRFKIHLEEHDLALEPAKCAIDILK